MSGSAKPRPSAAAKTDEQYKQLKRGFNWLGGATVAARIVDMLTTLAMLLLLTRKQVGIASLVLSIGMVVEAFNGLGTGQALIQARSVSRAQLDTVFWYALAAATATSGLTLLAAPWIGTAYGMTGITGYFVAIAAKQPLVGAAVVPLAMMNRDLQYRRIALVNVCATIAAAFTRLALGVAGAGAWALVAGYASSGLFILMGATMARPFRPRLRFRPSSVSGLLRWPMRRNKPSRTSTTCWSGGSTAPTRWRSTASRSTSRWSRRWRSARWSTAPRCRSWPGCRLHMAT